MSNRIQIKRSRKIGALVAYTTLACGLVSLGVYIYRQQQKSAPTGNNIASRRRTSDQSDSLEGQNQGSGANQDDGLAAEVRIIHSLASSTDDSLSFAMPACLWMNSALVVRPDSEQEEKKFDMWFRF